MKRSLMLIIAIMTLICSVQVASATCSSTSNVTWTTSRTLNSDYTMCGATLTIEEGVTVTLADDVSITIQDYNGNPGRLVVNGGLLSAKKVRFVSADTDPWGCMVIDNSSDNNRITNAIFDNGGNCEDANNGSYGMVSLLSGELLFQYSELKYADNDSGDGLALFVTMDGLIDMRNSWIHDNEWMGVMVADDINSEFHNIEVYNNAIGMYYTDSSTGNLIQNSDIYDNWSLGLFVGANCDVQGLAVTIEDNGYNGFAYSGGPYYTGVFFEDGITGDNDFYSLFYPNTLGNNGNSLYDAYDVYNDDPDISVDFRNVTWTGVTPPDNLSGDVDY